MRAPRPGFMDRIAEALAISDRVATPDEIAAAQSYLAQVESLPARDTAQPELPLTIEPRAA